MEIALMSDERKDENLPARPASSLMRQLIRQRPGADGVHFSNMRCVLMPPAWLLLILIVILASAVGFVMAHLMSEVIKTAI